MPATMNTQQMATIIRLSPHFQKDLKEFAQSNPMVHIDSDRDIVDAWLRWNGIIGYTDTIIELVLSVYGVPKKPNLDHMKG